MAEIRIAALPAYKSLFPLAFSKELKAIMVSGKPGPEFLLVQFGDLSDHF